MSPCCYDGLSKLFRSSFEAHSKKHRGFALFRPTPASRLRVASRRVGGTRDRAATLPIDSAAGKTLRPAWGVNSAPAQRQLRVNCSPVSERLKSTNRARELGGWLVSTCLILAAAASSLPNISR